jgi:hypothetical protein
MFDEEDALSKADCNVAGAPYFDGVSLIITVP